MLLHPPTPAQWELASLRGPTIDTDARSHVEVEPPFGLRAVQFARARRGWQAVRALAHRPRCAIGPWGGPGCCVIPAPAGLEKARQSVEDRTPVADLDAERHAEQPGVCVPRRSTDAAWASARPRSNAG